MDLKKIVGLFVVITLIVTFVPKVALAEAGYSFINEVGNVQTAEDWIPVTADTATLSSGWYVVNDNLTRNGTITVSGNAKLILD